MISAWLIHTDRCVNGGKQKPRYLAVCVYMSSGGVYVLTIDCSCCPWILAGCILSPLLLALAAMDDDYPDARSSFNDKGYAVIPGFASSDQVDGLRRRMAELVEVFDPKRDSTLNVFTTNEQVGVLV